jgi:hypothetical protein
MGTVKFKVLKKINTISSGLTLAVESDTGFENSDCYHLPVVSLLRLLPEYFLEIQPEGKLFDDEYEYTGKVEFPQKGDWFVTTERFALHASINHVHGQYNILRKIKKYT